MTTSGTVLLASIPPPPFDDITVAGLTFHGYGLIIGLAVVSALLVAERLLKLDGVPVDDYYAVTVPAVLGGFVGARLYHVLSEPVRYAEAPLDALKVWEGGLGIYGAIGGGAVVAMWLAPRRGIPRGALLDAAAPAIALAQAIGRWGNYLNQELFGRPSDLPWALEVEPGHRPAEFAGEATFQPTFLYESLGALLLAGVLLVLHRRWRTRASGVLMACWLVGYSIIRTLVEPLRIDPAHEWLGVRQNSWIAGLLILVGVAIVVVAQRRARAGRASSARG